MFRIVLLRMSLSFSFRMALLCLGCHCHFLGGHFEVVNLLGTQTEAANCGRGKGVFTHAMDRGPLVKGFR